MRELRSVSMPVRVDVSDAYNGERRGRRGRRRGRTDGFDLSRPSDRLAACRWVLEICDAVRALLAGAGAGAGDKNVSLLVIVLS